MTMSNIFNAGRFLDYFIYDLRNARNNYWLSALISGFMPIILFIFYELLYRTASGEWGSFGAEFQILAVTITFSVTVISFPGKVYGRLTEKRSGSSWLMLPASSFEKWLSMVLVVCVALPLFIGTLFLGSDAILSATISGYGFSLFSRMAELGEGIVDTGKEILRIDPGLMLFLNWCEIILSFTLGALVFKKAKAAKTILVWIILVLVILPVMMSIMGSTHISSEDLELMAESGSLEPFIRKINAVITTAYTLILGGLLAGTYIRIRTLKH